MEEEREERERGTEKLKGSKKGRRKEGSSEGGRTGMWKERRTGRRNKEKEKG